LRPLWIPEQHRPGLAKIRGLSDRAVSEIAAALSSVEDWQLRRNGSTFSVEEVPDEDLETLIGTLRTLYQVRAYSDLPLQDFVDQLVNAMATSGIADLNVPIEERAEFVNRMLKLLSFDSLSVPAKAYWLERDREHLFHEARILTDLRPVFSADPKAGPVGFAVLHTLKVVYHSGNEHKELYLAIDTGDIENVRSVLDRALNKGTSLDTLMNEKGIKKLISPA
jgi:hypothetical protein